MGTDARRAGLVAALLACVSVSAGAGAGAGRVQTLVSARPIAPFTLLDHEGRTFRSERELAGHVSLVFFGFAHCPDVCPMTLLRLQRLVASDRAFEGVRVLMVSVDGERDTPAVMKAFLAPISPKFVGVTGTEAQLRPVARSFSTAFYRQPATTPGGNYTVDHSAQVFLVDRSGRLAAMFFNASDEAMREALRAALR